MENLGSGTQGVREVVEAKRHHHELLYIHRIVGMLTAVDDIHHGCRQNVSTRAAQIAVEWLVRKHSRRLGGCQRNAQHGIGAQVLFVGGSIKITKHGIDTALIASIGPNERVSNFRVDVIDGMEDTFAHVLGFVAIA